MKRLFKTSIICILTTVLLVCTSLPTFSAAISPNHWAIDYADFCISFGAIAASRSAFSPNVNLKRYELAVALASIEGIACNDREEPDFTDTPVGSSYLGEVNWAVRNGIITGYSDGTFRPTNEITRQEFCVMMYRYITNYCEKTLPTSGSTLAYTDISSTASWARTTVNQLCWAGLFNGFEDNTFRPQDPIKRSEAASALTKIHGYIYIPDGSIAVFVKNSSGIALNDAVMYVYRPYDPNTDEKHMYPFSPSITDNHGIAISTNPVDGTSYGVNVMHNDYASIAVPTLLQTSKMYTFVELETRTILPNIVSPPAGSFSAISKWPHSNSADCNAICPNRFTRICPDTYFDATYPQNFGWRYGTTNQLEFHQAIDVSYNAGTPLYNVFGGSATVLYAGDYLGGGNTVQLRDDGHTIYRATYMHLQNISSGVYEGGSVTYNQQIGTVGNTGTTDVHLHFSVGTTNTKHGQTPDIIQTFIDPLSFFN